ncbi:MAG: glycosyltransferase [Bacteroidia bacterium]
MPVKDADPYLSDCLDSILNQSYENWELIAVDDHSSDQSLALLRRYERSNTRIKILANQGNGIVSALQLAYSNSKGDLIHRMDADDKMPPEKLKGLNAAWMPGNVVTGKVEYFSDEWLVGLGFQNYQNWLNGLMESGNHWKDIYMECPIPSPAWLIHRDDFDKCGAFDSELIPEDYDLCFRWYKHGIGIIALDEVVHLWRDSQKRTSRKNPSYFPMAYYPLKVHHFLSIDRDKKKPLILWGAGKKGKLISKLLNDKSVEYEWVTDNQKKWGVEINGKIISPRGDDISGRQLIIAIASPEDKRELKNQLKRNHHTADTDIWWFC